MNVVQFPNAVFALGLFILLGIRRHYGLVSQAERKVVRRFGPTEGCSLVAMFLTFLLLPLMYCFTHLLAFADYQLPSSIRWAGVLAMFISLWLFWRSHFDLDRNFSPTLELRQDHQLVSHGIYRRVRHPMYASLWLWSVAQGLTLANWLAGWGFLTTFAAMYFLRITREEQMMCEQFGDRYHAYAQRTGRLIPRFTTTAEPCGEPEPPTTRNLKS